MNIQIRDPVHNFIEFNEDETNLINTHTLQRLRGIRQLALASLVYPGALHTRFDHTLGVAHVAGSMARAVGLDEDAIRRIRLAALLHDIGHGPFSHVSEAALSRYADPNTLKEGQNPDKIHELVTALLIQGTPEVDKLLGARRCSEIVELLDRGHGEPVWRSIISGPLDADKQDYLLRDSRFCGVEYGVFDIRQLHHSLTKGGTKDMQALMIRPEGVHPVEQFALAKSYMHANVYRHKVRLITDQMIIRSIVLGVDEDKIESLRKLYAFDNTVAFVQNYSQWDDARFMHEFCINAPHTQCGKMLERLRTRHLLKRVFRCMSPELRPECREVIGKLKERVNDPLRLKVQGAISKELTKIAKQEVDAGAVILHRYELPSVRKSVQNNEGFFQVVNDDGEVVPFDKASLLFRSIEKALSEEWVEVYAPVDWHTAKDKKRITTEARDALKTIIETECSVNQDGAKP